MASTRDLTITVSKETKVGKTSVPAGTYQVSMDDARTIYMVSKSMVIRIPAQLPDGSDNVELMTSVIYFLS